ncbi:MAG: hypothetical protein WC130_03690 [Kiritimatiellia bacterium]
MGYNTEFKGVLEFTCPMDADRLAYLNGMLGDNPDDMPAYKKFGLQLSYIQYELTKDFKGIQYDGNEKFYFAENACNYIIKNMQAKYPDFGLSGYLDAQGEDMEDRWRLVIVDGVAVREDMTIVGLVKCPECDHKFVPEVQ